jgi:hypothetical protein
MMDLSHRKRSLAERAELDELPRRYPGMPLKDYNPHYEFCRWCNESVREAAANGLIQLTKPKESYYSTENAGWELVDRCRSGRR